jgi:hypothetical protein
MSSSTSASLGLNGLSRKACNQGNKRDGSGLKDGSKGEGIHLARGGDHEGGDTGDERALGA